VPIESLTAHKLAAYLKVPRSTVQRKLDHLEEVGSVLVGSPKLSAALQRLDLVDEYRFVVHPVVAGHGPFLFSGLQPSLRLKFVAATRLKSGIVALHYRRR
jgi:riboflavin biosynthesis pyrimidine reductase